MADYDLRAIDEHCAAVVELFIYGMECAYDEGWLAGMSMLGVASGIASVEYGRLRFDTTLGFCESADEFSQHQEILENKLVASLCRFNFIWSAVESIIDVAIPSKNLKSPAGKINNACFFLKHNCHLNVAFVSYVFCLERLKALILCCSQYGDFLKKNYFGDHVSLAGQGIYLAYRLRNRLAHGALGLPITRQEDENHIDNEIVELCSRLVLYSIQMLIAIRYRNSTPTVSWGGEEVEMQLAFTHVQYARGLDIVMNTMQLDLDFN